MIRKLIRLAPVWLLLAGCNFAEDITPPPALATAQAAAPAIQPSPTAGQIVATPTSSPSAQVTPEAIASPEIPAEQGVVEGSVVNGSQGGEVPANLEITLYGIDGQQPALEVVTELDDQGRFRFEGLEPVGGRVYVAVAEHQGVIYGSEMGHLNADGQPTQLTLVVHETSQDLSTILVDRLHVVFDFSIEGRISVLELWVISNTSDRTVATEQGAGLLEIALPAGAENLSFESGSLGDRYLSTESGFIDTAPLRPGASSGQLVFSFELPYTRRLDFSQPLAYPVGAVVVLSEEGGPRIEGQGLEDMGTRETGQVTLRTYIGASMMPGDQLDLRISGRPGGSVFSSIEPRLALAIGIGALGLVLVVAGLWWYRAQSASANLSEDALEEALAEGMASREQAGVAEWPTELLEEIAALDDAFEAGDLSQEAYQKRRSALMQQALGAMKDDDD